MEPANTNASLVENLPHLFWGIGKALDEVSMFTIHQRHNNKQTPSILVLMKQKEYQMRQFAQKWTLFSSRLRRWMTAGGATLTHSNVLQEK
jgi:hypothetical protein